MDKGESSGITVVSSEGYEVKLTRDQASCVDFKGEKTQLVVKGAAGAGKSLVLMSKAVKIMGGYQAGMKNGVLILTYTNSLTAYAKEFLDPKDHFKEFIKVCTFDSLISDICKTMRWYPDYPRGSVASPSVREDIIRSLLKSRSRSSNHRFYRLRTDSDVERNVNFWSEEFQWMMGLGFTVDDEDRYLDTDRRGRGTTRRMNTADRVEAFSFYTEYIRKLHSSRRIDRLEQPLFLDNHIGDIPDEFRYDYVLVDEAQDLPITSIHVAIGLSKKEVLIAMDANQRLYPHRWKMKDLGIPVTTRSLKKSFRCTKQIDSFAEALRVINEQYLDSDDIFEHNVPDLEGTKPLVIEYSDLSAEMRGLVAIIQQMLSNPKVTVAVILRRKREIYQWAEYLSSRGIYHEIIMGGYNQWKKSEEEDVYSKWAYSTRSPGLKLCTIHSAKGLEFHNVIIPHFKSRRYPPPFRQDDGMSSGEAWDAHYRNLCYVAMTRARANLIVSFHGDPSKYLDEIFDYVIHNDGEADVDESLWPFTSIDASDADSADDMMSLLEFNIGFQDTSGASAQIPSIRYGPDSKINKQDIGQSGDTCLFNSYLKKAECGDVQSMHVVADCYVKGTGVPQNRSTAIEWYRKGSIGGDPDCMYQYGLSLIDGTYVNQNVAEGIHWLNGAANLNQQSACGLLGKILMEGKVTSRDTAVALQWYSKAAASGDRESQQMLIKIYRDGLYDVRPNIDQYHNWLSVASVAGDPSAQYEYALHLIEEGEYDDALELLQSSADSGEVRSQFELCSIYYEGKIVGKDDKVSRLWLKKSVNQEYPPAEYRMFEALRDGLFGHFDQEGSMRYLRRSAKHGFGPAISELEMISGDEEKVERGPQSIVMGADTKGSSESVGEMSTNVSTGDSLIDDLQSRGFKVIDRRGSNGPLWVLDAPEVRDYMECSETGTIFKYSKNGSRSTGHRPGWYM